MLSLLAAAPLLAMGPNNLWYAVPLIVSISLVYGATRHEQTGRILNEAVRMGGWIVGFMAVIFVIIALVSWWA